MNLHFFTKQLSFFIGILLLTFLSIAPLYSETAPVELKFFGLTPDKKNVHFQLKINTDKPIKQIDILLKCFDANGKLIRDYAYYWQNIVPDPVTHGTKWEDIKPGRLYHVSQPDLVEPGSVRIEGKLGYVTYKDGSYWKP